MPDLLPTQLDLRLVTPERQVFRGKVEAVSVPSKNGYLGILPGHAPLLSELKAGEISYTQKGLSHYLAVSWGFVEVLPEQVIVLVHSSELPEEIDVDRAQSSRHRAEERLKKLSEEVDMDRARASLERAMNRLEVAARKRANE